MNIIDFVERRARVENDPEVFSQERAYITQTTEFAVQTAEELGLAAPFMAILAKHIQDLGIITTEYGDSRRAALSVYKDESAPILTYKRAAIINPTHVEMYASSITKALHAIVGENAAGQDDPTVPNMALDWTMYELCADALGNSCYMQHSFDGYIKDFNGQSTSYNSHDTVVREFLKEYASDFTEVDVAREHESFRSGFALQLLKNDLLRNKLCSSLKQAEWVVAQISKNYPTLGIGRKITPMHHDDLMSRCINVKTKPSRARLAELVLSFESE